MFLLACHSSVADGFTIPQKPKTLLQILVEELPKRGGWPDDCHAITQDSDAAINTYNSVDGLEINAYGTWRYLNSWIDYCITAKEAPRLASDYATAIITRDQYEAALAAKNDGWIDWAGGECPVDGAAFVEYKMRSGDVGNDDAHILRWDHKQYSGDIIAYRLHQPQDANSRANDDRLGFHVHSGVKGNTTGVPDEADLNDCIGQAQENISEIRGDLLEVLNSTGLEVKLANAIKVANALIDAGYRKQ